MEKFFVDFFLEGSAIYTLFGTKPMSQITIVKATEEEWIESAAPYLQTESEEQKNEIVRKIRQHYQNYDLPKNWEKWMACQKKCTHSLFLFAKRPVPDNKTLFSAYIINVPEVAWTLQKHYLLFSRELKMDFDPVDAALAFEEPDSIFWEKVFANHLLQGILHGYGERNAYFFFVSSHKKKSMPNALTIVYLLGTLLPKMKEKVTLLKIYSYRSLGRMLCLTEKIPSLLSTNKKEHSFRSV